MEDSRQGEGAETPENKRMGEPGQRSVADHFGLQEHFSHNAPDARPDGGEPEIRVRPGASDCLQNPAEPPPKGGQREQDQDEQNAGFQR